MKKQILAFGIMSLLLFILLSGCSGVWEKPNMDVTITDVFYSQAKYGEGKTVFLNITFTNKGDKEIRHIRPLLIITDLGRGRLLTSFEHFEEIPVNESVNITVYTWDDDFACDCLNWDEKPVTFVYTYGSGEMFAPASAHVEIPKSLISE